MRHVGHIVAGWALWAYMQHLQVECVYVPGEKNLDQKDGAFKGSLYKEPLESLFQLIYEPAAVAARMWGDMC